MKELKKNKAMWLIFTAVLLGLCFIGIVSAIQISAKDTQKKYSQKIDLGNKYLDEMDYEMAVASFVSAMEIDPKNEEAYVALADTYILLNEITAAVEILEIGYERTTSQIIQEKQLEVEEIQQADGLLNQADEPEGQDDTGEMESENWNTAEEFLKEDFLKDMEFANLINQDINYSRTGDFAEILEKPVGTGLISAKLYDLDGDGNPELVLVYYAMIEGEKHFVVDLYTWDQGKYNFVENLIEENAYQSSDEYFFYTYLFIRQTEDTTYLCWFDKSEWVGDPTRYYFYQYRDGEVIRDSLVEAGATDITKYWLMRNDEDIYREIGVPGYSESEMFDYYSSYEEAVNGEMEKLGFKEEYFTLDDGENEYICFIEHRWGYGDNIYHIQMIDYTNIREE